MGGKREHKRPVRMGGTDCNLDGDIRDGEERADLGGEGEGGPRGGREERRGEEQRDRDREMSSLSGQFQSGSV